MIFKPARWSSAIVLLLASIGLPMAGLEAFPAEALTDAADIIRRFFTIHRQRYHL